MRSGVVQAQDQPSMRTSIRLPTLVTSLLLGTALLAGCAAAAGRTVQLQLRTLNESGVTGYVTLTAIDEQRTRVEIEVDPAGHLSMPAHIHPGTCDELIPQPKYPLQNVVDGASISEVPAPLEELLRGDVAVNIHKSNEEMEVYTACVELG
jgi:hypothetical protein